MQELKSNTANKAAQELDILFRQEPESELLPMKDAILGLLEAYGNSGQSGGSHPFVSGLLLQTIERLLNQDPICALTGEDSEWVDVASGVFQNNRCGAVFKDAAVLNGRPYFLDAISFVDQEGLRTGGVAQCWIYGKITAIQPITFPFHPNTFEIDVIRNPDGEKYVFDSKDTEAALEYFNPNFNEI